MLVLTRSVREAIVIGEDIQVIVLGIYGRQVKLGVVAPKELAVDREEIALRKAKDATTHD